MGIFLGTMAKNKIIIGDDFFLALYLLFFLFGVTWIILIKPATFPEFGDIETLNDKDSKFIRKMKEFDRTHK